MCALGALVASTLLSSGVSARNAHQASKAQKSAANAQAEAQNRAEAARANAAAAAPGAQHALDMQSSMSAAKRLRGIQSTMLASRGTATTSSTLGTP